MSIKGTVKLRVTLRMWPSIVSLDVDFLVVDTLNMVYNTILGKMSLNKAKVIISTFYLLMNSQHPIG